MHIGKNLPICQLNKPPEFGVLEFSVVTEPVSLQAKKKKKQKLKNVIHQVIKGVKYYLSGEVQIEIEWLVHERERYETDSSPDIDNIVKPMLDALSGQHGILIDDCQVQAVSCNWIDWTQSDQQINFRIKYLSDEWILKDSLFFVDFGNNLCFPVHSNWTKGAIVTILDAVEDMLLARQEIEQKSEDYYAAKQIMPIQRLFHRTRLEGQYIVKKDEYLSSLEGK